LSQRWGRLGESGRRRCGSGDERRLRGGSGMKELRFEGWSFLLYDAKTIRDVRPPINGPK
jgi:hypothetical protein